jgi:L-cysteate sulfo-lyase
LEPLARLTELLAGPRLYIKRDDCTGLATGGNKTRKLEFLLGEALAENADTVITAGAVQSNHVRQTAAAAAKLGMRCKVLLERRVARTDPEYQLSGNVLLDRLFGAELVFCPRGTDLGQAAAKLSEQVRDGGGRPYWVPVGGSNRVGALGYVNCALELLHQANEQRLRLDYLIHPTGSAGTQAGLITGLEGSRSGIAVFGISVDQAKEVQESKVVALSSETAEHLGIELDLPGTSVVVNSDYIGPGYGQPTPAMVEAVSMVARQEGIALDPVYSGKAMAGLIDLVNRGTFSKSDTVVFLHTGGTPALFAYRQTFNSDG